MKTITIEYTASVRTPAGWRGITITAEADQVSKGTAAVKKVISIDGEDPHYGMTRTGATRQQYNGKGVALREIGAKKRISACKVVA